MQVFECQFCAERINYDEDSGRMPGACEYCNHTTWMESLNDEDEPLDLVWRSYNDQPGLAL